VNLDIREVAALNLDADADDDDIDREARRLTAANLLGEHRRLFHGGIEKPESCSTCAFLGREATR